MPGIEYTQDNWPSADEFVGRLREVEAQYDPVNKLLMLERELAILEQTHGISSEEFLQRYQAGKMGDAPEFIRWVGQYKLYLNLRSMISASLQLVITEGHTALA